jgi:hypothetical protein
MRTLLRVKSAALAALMFAACTSGAATPTAPVTQAPAGSGKTLTIAYEESAQVELIAPSGQRVLIDVADPTALTASPTEGDVLLTSHLHSDHYYQDFVDAFPGRQLFNKSGTLTSGDVTVVSIDASHTDDPIDPADPTNHIFVIDFAGFKVVHMGSTGQTALTAEQLAAIGSDVDVMFMTLTNVGGSDPDDAKAIDVVNQVKPRIVVPTHSSLNYVQAAGNQWAATWSSHKTVTVPKGELPARTTLLCMGNIAVSYGAILKVPETKW